MREDDGDNRPAVRLDCDRWTRPPLVMTICAGGRLDVLRTLGAGRARAILVCVDGRATISRIVELLRHEFPHARLYVRSFDRGHSIDPIGQNVDYQIRETFESAMAMGRATRRGRSDQWRRGAG